MRAETTPRMPLTSHPPPHAAPRAGSMGSTAREETYRGKNHPACPRTVFGPSPTTRCAYVWPRPGGSCQCTKEGAHLCTPLPVRGQSEPRPRSSVVPLEPFKNKVFKLRRQGPGKRSLLGRPTKALQGTCRDAPCTPARQQGPGKRSLPRKPTKVPRGPVSDKLPDPTR